jgi:hypothetical protein
MKPLTQWWFCCLDDEMMIDRLDRSTLGKPWETYIHLVEWDTKTGD